jgi:hypothetical protein
MIRKGSDKGKAKERKSEIRKSERKTDEMKRKNKERKLSGEKELNNESTNRIRSSKETVNICC